MHAIRNMFMESFLVIFFLFGDEPDAAKIPC